MLELKMVDFIYFLIFGLRVEVSIISYMTVTNLSHITKNIVKNFRTMTHSIHGL